MLGIGRKTFLTVAGILSGLGSVPFSASLAAPLVGMDATGASPGLDAAAPSEPSGTAVNSLQAVGAAEADPAAKPLIKGDLRTFDVSGFKLGMSPADVQRVASAAHLLASDGHRRLPFDSDRHGTRGADFKLNVARAAALRLGQPRPSGPTVVSEVLLYGPTGEKYYVDFLPMESGPQLSTVLLIASSKGNTPKSFLDAVVAKYGKPPQAQVGVDRFFAKWCSRGFATCDDGPWFMVGADDHEEQVKLTVGDRARIDLDRRVEAAGAAAAASAATKPKL